MPSLRARRRSTSSAAWRSAILLVYAVPQSAPQPGADRSRVHARATSARCSPHSRRTRSRRSSASGRRSSPPRQSPAPMLLFIPLAPVGNAACSCSAGLRVSGFANVVYNITQVSFRQAITPERIQGRMNSVMRFIVWGTIPLGQLVGGALATRYRPPARRCGSARSAAASRSCRCCSRRCALFARCRSRSPRRRQKKAFSSLLLVDAAAVTVQHPGT